ncbi:MAG: J domain-containing protein [Bdellovibrionota bacterium]
MSDWKFHCDVLSVSETASPAEIKAAFRKLALRTHPDRNGGTASSKEKFQRINVSYRYLMRNLSSRPAPKPPAPPRSAAAHISPRTPTSKASPWAEKIGRFLSAPAPSPSLAPVMRFLSRRKDSILAFLPAATALIAVLISMLAFMDHHKAERAPASDRDDLGRVAARCQLQFYQGGNLVDTWTGELSQWDCDLRCMAWISDHEQVTDVCSWKGVEFRRHTGVPKKPTR